MVERIEDRLPQIYITDFRDIALRDRNQPIHKLLNETTDPNARARLLAVLTYYRGDHTLSEIGQGFQYEDGPRSVSLEGVRQWVKSWSYKVWSMCSDETKERVPFHSIILKRPPYGVRLVRDPEFQILLEKSDGMVIDANELKKLAPTRSLFVTTRKSLRDEGYEVSRLGKDRKKLARQLSSASKEEVGKFLLEVESGFYQVYSTGDNPLLISLTKLVAGIPELSSYRRYSEDYIRVLTTYKIPIGRFQSKSNQDRPLIYNFIARQHQDEATEVLKTSPILDRLRKK